MQRKPKDTTKFLHPVIAATRLLNIAMENMLWQRHGTRVKWTLKVEFWYTDEFRPGKDQVACSNGFTVSSGEDNPSVEAALTGRGTEELTDAPVAEEEI